MISCEVSGDRSFDGGAAYVLSTFLLGSSTFRLDIISGQSMNDKCSSVFYFGSLVKHYASRDTYTHTHTHGISEAFNVEYRDEEKNPNHTKAWRVRVENSLSICRS